MKKRIMFSAVVMMSLALLGCNQGKQTAAGEMSTNEVSTNEVSTNEVSSQEEINQLPSEPAGDYLKNAMNKTLQLNSFSMESVNTVDEGTLTAVFKKDSTGMMYMSQKQEESMSDNGTDEKNDRSGEMYLTAPDSDGDYAMYSYIPGIEEGWTKIWVNNKEYNLAEETPLNTLDQSVSANSLLGVTYGAEDNDYIIVFGRTIERIVSDEKPEFVPCHADYYINKNNGLLEKVEIMSLEGTTYYYMATIKENKDSIVIPKEALEEAGTY